uniref:Uncharacterized protein n=1 Tax=Oryza nivara TaxID=4536 RepID=A0A0E0FFC2_ORYNI
MTSWYCSDSSGEPTAYRIFVIFTNIDSYFSICGRHATQLPHPFVVLLMLVPQTFWILRVISDDGTDQLQSKCASRLHSGIPDETT